MAIAILLLNLVPTLLTSIPGLSATLKGIITDVTSSAGAILSSGAVTQPNITTILASWAGVINALKTQANLPASTLNLIAALEQAVQAALLNDATAAAAVDWSKVGPIAPVA